MQAVPTGVRPKSVPELPAPLVAERDGGWPRVLATGAVGEPKKTVHRRFRMARSGHDRMVTASIAGNLAKKKRKARTAETTGFGFDWFAQLR